MILNLQSLSADETENIGRGIGEKLRGGEIIELSSDLGGGKTTFVRGLVAGSGSHDKVASPSFTISRIYKTNKFTIHHFDFYRMTSAGIMSFELSDLFDDTSVVIVIEWADIVKKALPAERLEIRFENLGENERQLVLKYPDSMSYLI